MNLELTEDEQRYYAFVFSEADKDSDGIIRGREGLFLSSSGLEKHQLAKIWQFADHDGKGYLTCNDFYVALKLVSYVQKEKYKGNTVSAVTAEMLTVSTPLPEFVGLMSAHA